MDLAWLAPPITLAVGAAAAAGLARAIERSLHDLRASQRRLRRLEDGLIPLRVETRRVRESVDRLRRR